ncbi:MAG: shikimate kinase [Oceanococcaceae bacterium]
MKIALLGNAGSGKTTLSKALLALHEGAVLSLDAVAFANGPERKPVDQSVQAAQAFMASHPHWVIEGCYADILEPLLPECEQLVFLNPGVEVCLQHCRQRPWEPDKFPTAEAQDAHLQALLDWVRLYDTRSDEYGLQQHRRLFDAHPGRKQEFRRVDHSLAGQILAERVEGRIGR